MEIRQLYYHLTVRDVDGNIVEPSELTDEDMEVLSDNIANGGWSGTMEIEDDSDEWEEMNRGDEIRDYRKNDC